MFGSQNCPMWYRWWWYDRLLSCYCYCYVFFRGFFCFCRDTIIVYQYLKVLLSTTSPWWISLLTTLWVEFHINGGYDKSNQFGKKAAPRTVRHKVTEDKSNPFCFFYLVRQLRKWSYPSQERFLVPSPACVSGCFKEYSPYSLRLTGEYSYRAVLRLRLSTAILVTSELQVVHPI